MKSVVDQFFRHGLGAPEQQVGTFSPAIDVEETPAEYNVRAELPGLKEEDIEVSVEENTLIVSGHKAEETERKEEGRYYFESRSGEFRRAIPLEAPVDEDNISAQLKKGVLNIQIPKKAEEQPLKRRIEVTPG